MTAFIRQSKKPYEGSRRGLVIAFDVGTTYSGISYCVLDPGVVPQIRAVTKFPGHENILDGTKVPSVIFYDPNENVRAVGAETLSEEVIEKALDEDWYRAEWFKLHLRSRQGAGKAVMDITEVRPLPPNKGIVDVFADFLRYLLLCIKTHIKTTHLDGESLWESLEGESYYVLSHPNGWEGREQDDMRKAAIQAGLVPETKEGKARLSFVTEGEASLHFAVHNGLQAQAMIAGDGVVVVDAGGGTIDISSYCKSKTTRFYEEIAPPQCYFNGSVFVTISAKIFLQSFLQESDYFNDLEEIVRVFDKSTKLTFSSEEQAQYIKFGTWRDNDAEHAIKYGQLKLEGSDVASFFKRSVDAVVRAVFEQARLSCKRITHVVMVGGFSASNWLVNQVKEQLEPIGYSVYRSENYQSKAVADGAVLYYLDDNVHSRVSKLTYGVFCNTLYEPSLPDHLEREGKKITTIAGELRIPNFFGIILKKNVQVSAAQEFRYSLNREVNAIHELQNVTFDFHCYRGALETPKWKDVEPDQYSKVCTLYCDLTAISPEPMTNPSGRQYYKVVYDVILKFGLTEFQAYVSWMENGVEKRSDPAIVYDS